VDAAPADDSNEDKAPEVPEDAPADGTADDAAADREEEAADE
jgi:hypothetical protein